MKTFAFINFVIFLSITSLILFCSLYEYLLSGCESLVLLRSSQDRHQICWWKTFYLSLAIWYNHHHSFLKETSSSLQSLSIFHPCGFEMIWFLISSSCVELYMRVSGAQHLINWMHCRKRKHWLNLTSLCFIKMHFWVKMFSIGKCFLCSWK